MSTSPLRRLPAVGTEIPALAKDGIAATELVAPPVEEVCLIKAAAPGEGREAVNEIEIGPAIVEEKMLETNATADVVSATVGEKPEPPKEDLAVVEPVALPSAPAVETEISVEPEYFCYGTRCPSHCRGRTEQGQ